MNEIFSSLMNDGLAEAMEMMGETVSIGGKTINAIVSNTEFAEDLLDGGLLSKRGITAVVAFDDLAEMPAVGSKIGYNGFSYRIKGIVPDAFSFEIQAESDSK